MEMPLNIVGGNKFGRYNKISDEKTFNMVVSDEWLVPYAGYNIASQVNSSFRGRAIFTSARWGNMISVVGNTVYGVSAPYDNSPDINVFFIGEIDTYTGDVFIDENIAGQIAICDGFNIYIYNWQTPSTPALQLAILPIDPRTSETIIPGFITYQDGYFITGNKASASWFLSSQNNGLNWNWGASGGPVTTSIQSKPCNFISALRAPGRGNLLYVFGQNVTEMWNDTGGAIFPYTRIQSSSVDYGCVSPTSIAAMDTTVAWLGINERSGPVIMVSSGSDITKLSNDGIDFQLARVQFPEQSYGFFFKQDGHLFYQLTFYNPEDNFTLVYDFNTKMFFYATDENMNYHIAERVAFFNNTYYFVSINDGNIYRMSSDLTTYDYTVNSLLPISYEIPRVRVCAPTRLPDSSRFIGNSLTFTLEQGNDPYFQGFQITLITQENGTIITQENGVQTQTELVVEPYQPRVDMAISRDGAENFGSYYPKPLNPQGVRKNRVVYWQLGSANDMTVQFRFWSQSRVVVTNGMVSIYQ